MNGKNQFFEINGNRKLSHWINESNECGKIVTNDCDRNLWKSPRGLFQTFISSSGLVTYCGIFFYGKGKITHFAACYPRHRDAEQISSAFFSTPGLDSFASRIRHKKVFSRCKKHCADKESRERDKAANVKQLSVRDPNIFSPKTSDNFIFSSLIKPDEEQKFSENFKNKSRCIFF